MAKSNCNNRRRRSNNNEDFYDEELRNIIKENFNKITPGFEEIKSNHFKYKNKKQKEYATKIKENDITICTGPAGTGKSYIAIATALELLRNPETPYKKLVFITSPLQTVDENIGFLKGSMEEKLSPFVYSYLHNLADLVVGGLEKVEKLVESGFIEVHCVSFMRGLNLKNSLVICGESQQYGKDSMLTIITRLCDNSRLIIEGDVEQCDNHRVKNGQKISGLRHAQNCLKEVKGIDFVEFDKTHVVRNPIITRILTRWDPDTYGNEDEYGLEVE